MTPEREALEAILHELNYRWEVHGGPFDSEWMSLVLDAFDKAAAPGEPGPCPKCGCDSYIAGAPSWKYDEKWSAVASVTCDKCDHEWDIGLALRREAPAPAVDLTNHHNALKCPYCNPEGLTFARPDTAEARLREALEWADDLYASLVGFEPKNNQQREAVEGYAKARNATISPPSGGDEAKESEGQT